MSLNARSNSAIWPPSKPASVIIIIYDRDSLILDKLWAGQIANRLCAIFIEL